MFVLSLVKKHYRLQFYMVCISLVTLSSSSSQPLTALSIILLLFKPCSGATVGAFYPRIDVCLYVAFVFLYYSEKLTRLS